jgi:drug/metabolite transporter, DME family
LNNALAIGEVAVIPIVSATPLFTLLMTFVYVGRQTITWRTIAIALIVPGVIVVALSGGR